MASLATFSGGLHPPELKTTAAVPIIDLPAPMKVVLPLSQHIGAPARPLVKIGDVVDCGQLVAEAGGFVSAPIHATIAGKVVAIGNFLHPLGVNSPAIVIEGTADQTTPQYPSEDWGALSMDELKTRIQASGLVGLGGATFPTHVKLSPPPSKPIDIVILNGVECEPALTSDHRLMIEQADQIVTGLKIILKILKATRGIIGIEANKPDAIALLAAKIRGIDGLSIVPLEVKYPQGGEKQLIVATVKKEVPSGGLPMDVGVIVQNVATAAAIADAVCRRRPLLERVVTLAGSVVSKPGNYRTRIGTLVSTFIEATGGLKADIPLRKVIMGGPMMGSALFDLAVPIVKGTGGLLCWSEIEATMRVESPCIRCGRCIEACPMCLLPQTLKALIDAKRVTQAGDFGVLDCIECGCCSFACPSNLPLVQALKLGKKLVSIERTPGKPKEGQ